jgi:hypothetical protein
MAAAGDMNVTFQGIPPETRAERRERIAVQMMAALCSPQHTFSSWEDQAHDAVAMAEALMVILDKSAANDKQKGGE